MKPVLFVCLISGLLLQACTLPSPPSDQKPLPSPGVETATLLPTPVSPVTTLPAASPSPAPAGFRPQSILPAQVQVIDQAVVTGLFSSDCLEVVTTPLVVDGYIIFGVNKRSPKPGEAASPAAQCENDPAQPGVFAVSATSGEAYVLSQGVSVEGTPTYTGDTLIVPLVGNGGGILWWGAGTGRQTRPLKAGIDSAGLWDGRMNAYIVGSVNTPFPLCQNGPNADCGALVAVSPGGEVLARLDRTSGLRGWTTGGPTGDGHFFYIGNGAGTDGETVLSGNPLHACSVIKLDRDFNLLAAYDDGEPGCVAIGKLESAVVGEVPVVDGILWVQYLGSTDGTPSAPVVRLNAADLTPICRAELPIIPGRSAAGFYQAPVVDAEGNAYVTAAVPDNGMKVSLYRIAPDCSVTRLYDTGSAVTSTPTLADDRWVLLAETGVLHRIDQKTGVAQDIPLPVTDDVHAGVVVSDYGVTIITLHGTVITLTGTGIQGYGSAPWPRFRRDNYGSAY